MNKLFLLGSDFEAVVKGGSSFCPLWIQWLSVTGCKMGHGMEGGAWQEWGCLLWATGYAFTENISGGNRNLLVSRLLKFMFILFIKGLSSRNRLYQCALFYIPFGFMGLLAAPVLDLSCFQMSTTSIFMFLK